MSISSSPFSFGWFGNGIQVNSIAVYYHFKSFLLSTCNPQLFSPLSLSPLLLHVSNHGVPHLINNSVITPCLLGLGSSLALWEKWCLTAFWDNKAPLCSWKMRFQSSCEDRCPITLKMTGSFVYTGRIPYSKFRKRFTIFWFKKFTKKLVFHLNTEFICLWSLKLDYNGWLL